MGENEPGLSRMERYQPIVLMASLFLGLFIGNFVEGIESLSNLIVYFSLIVLMYGIALGTPIRNVARSFSNRRFFAISLADNFIIIPVLGLILAAIFLNSTPLIFVGFILYVVNPCTDWFLVFTGMAKGDVPLGLALLPVNLLLQILLIPLYLWLFAGETVPFQIGAFFETAIVFILIPFILAIGTNVLAERKLGMERKDRTFNQVPITIQTVSLGVIIFFMFAGQAHTIMNNGGPLLTVLVPVAIFFVASYYIASWISRAARLRYGEMALLSCTTCARNSPLALAIAFGIFPDQPLIYVAIIIGVLIEIPVLIILVKVLTGRKGRYCQLVGESMEKGG